jgi:ubiquinone/menaquinone biosynthesis C-methylase UbiE
MNTKQAGGSGPHQLQIALKSLKNVDWEDKRILDIGCSNGYITNEILKFTSAKEIIGIDIESDRILKAKQLKRKFKENRLKFFKADSSNLSMFDSNSFDGIFSNMTFQQIPPEKINLALGEVKRLLKSGGLAIINFNQRKSDVTFEIQKLLKEKNATRFKKLNLKLFKDYATKAGFSRMKCITRLDTYYHKSLDNLLGNSKDTTWRFQNVKLNERQIEEIWNKVRNIFEKRKLNLGYEETWNMVFAQLVK